MAKYYVHISGWFGYNTEVEAETEDKAEEIAIERYCDDDELRNFVFERNSEVYVREVKDED